MIQLAIRRPVTVCMFVVAVALFGLVSLQRMALNLLPEIAYPPSPSSPTTRTRLPKRSRT